MSISINYTGCGFTHSSVIMHTNYTVSDPNLYALLRDLLTHMLNSTLMFMNKQRGVISAQKRSHKHYSKDLNRLLFIEEFDMVLWKQKNISVKYTEDWEGRE